LKNIGFDLDGVLARTDQILREEILNEFQFDIHPINQYMINIPGLSPNEFKLFVRKVLKRTSPDILPYNDTVEIIEKIYNKTQKPITIITARDFSVCEETHAWCRKWLTVPYSLHFRSSFEKKYVMLYYGIGYYLDDKLDTLVDLSNCTSIKCMLMNRSWNQTENGLENIIRVNNLTEFYNVLF
jgi:uncharacterized HAD superfamily protein